MSTVHSIDKHHDILALRAGYERASESLIAQGVFGLRMLVAVYAVASPWIVGFDAATRLTINDLIVGIGPPPVSRRLIYLGSAPSGWRVAG